MRESKNQEVVYFLRERPVVSIVSIFFIAFAVALVLFRFELTPEIEDVRWTKNAERRNLTTKDNIVWLGTEVAPITRDVRKEFSVPRNVKGVFVPSAGKGSAAMHGIKTGDIICGINRSQVTNPKSFIHYARSAKYFDGILLDVFRDGKRVYITIPFLYEHGPVVGPHKGHWDLGAPVYSQALPYGPLFQPQQKITKNR